jgi:DNA-binding MarR family transcriptional regulator
VGGFIEFDPKNRTEMELLLPRLLILAGEQTERAGDQVIFGKFDLNVVRFSLLASLARSPRPLSMTEVKDFMVRSPANLTQIVDHLEQRKLVRRIPREGDRRVNVLELTPEGYQLLGKVREDFERTMRDFFGGKSLDQLNGMILTLTDLIQGMFKLQGLELPRLRET